MPIDPRIRARIDEKRSALERLRPLNAMQLKKLLAELQLEMTYHSNAIEGNTLTLRETQLVLEEGMTIKGKPLRDHLEAKDHSEALAFLEELAGGGRITVSESLIRQLHQLVTRETERQWAGRYREGAVAIAGALHAPPEGMEVPSRMSDLIRWVAREQKRLHPVELAALVHHRLVNIHPFLDGNGRTARLVMNCLLIREGYPLTVILRNDRKRYYRTLQQADRGRAEPFVLFVAQAVERSLDMYLRALAPSGGRLMTLAELSRSSPYSAKYLNLLVRSGRLAAQKRGRNWYTTRGALEAYRRGRLRKRD
ncbi:MAG: Fic family protein [Myxococcaceae bacterium]